jgi:ABC-type glycerol-3-phosphate transport system substrate-binding protein
MKRGLALAFAAGLACTGEPNDQTVLRVMAWAGPDEREIEQRLLDDFRDRHPSIRIEYESISANYRERLLTSIVAGSPPDVALLDNGSFGAAPFIARGLLVNLATYLDRVGVDTSAYYPQVLEIFRRPGGLYAFPKDFNPIVVYLNRKRSRATSTATVGTRASARECGALSISGSRGSGRPVAMCSARMARTPPAI